MCSSPKVPKTQEKKPQYLRNPFLDGLAIGGGQNAGRNDLRVERQSLMQATPPPVKVAPPASGIPAASSPTPSAPKSGLNAPRRNQLLL